MFPPLVLLHQDLARTCLAYRFHRLQAAIDKAKNYGFKGKWDATRISRHETQGLPLLFLQQNNLCYSKVARSDFLPIVSLSG